MPPKPTDERIVTIKARPEDAGEKLDRWLARMVQDLSRARVQALIRSGRVTAEDGVDCATIGDVTHRVKQGAVYSIAAPDAVEATVCGESIALNIVYEDSDVIVIDKPAGLVVHPAAGHATGTLVNALIAHCGKSLSGVGGVKRPGIVHRLDKDTSGLLVVAKNDAAHLSLSDQFSSHGRDGRLHRAYLALIWKAPLRRRGTIDARLTRSAANRKKIAIARGSAGRAAVTHYEVLETFAGDGEAAEVSLVRLTLETGRTHQIRVHLAHINHPILGDAAYGSGFKTRASRLPLEAQRLFEGLHRQALHAAELTFEHPRTGKKLALVSALPKDMVELIAALRREKSPSAPTETMRRRRSRKA